MNDIERFLAHAIALEGEAARRYEELAAATKTDGNRELSAFFARMAHFSRLHLADARARGGFRDLPVLAPDQYEWPDGTGPETAAWAGVDAFMTPRNALLLALDGERRGHAYYSAIAAWTQDPEVKAVSMLFAAEEAEHVAELQRLLASASV